MERRTKVGLAGIVALVAVVTLAAQAGVDVHRGKVQIRSSATDALAVTGGATLGGALTATGSVTSSGLATGNIVTSGSLSQTMNGPLILQTGSTSATNEGVWGMQGLAAAYRFFIANDDLGGQTSWMTVERSTNTPTKVTIVPVLQLNGELRPAVTRSGTAQPGFLAYGTSQQNITTQATVAFSSEVYDTGGDYASNVFTAPLSGIYHLCSSVLFSTGADYTMWIVTSNRSYRLGGVSDGGSIGSTAACVYADMDASDTAYVSAVSGGGTLTVSAGTSTDIRAYFSGRLAS